MSEEARHREMIEAALQEHGYTDVTWAPDPEEDGRLRATVGRFVLIEDQGGDIGGFEGDEGVLSVSVVGAEKFHNERVYFAFTPDGMDVGGEVDPMILEPLD